MSHAPPPPPQGHHHQQPPAGRPSISTAQREEELYHDKYRDLKRKTKEIEQENEKISMQILQTKHNIQRLRLERSILYERLAATEQVQQQQAAQRESQHRHAHPHSSHANATPTSQTSSRQHQSSQHQQTQHSQQQQQRPRHQHGHAHAHAHHGHIPPYPQQPGHAHQPAATTSLRTPVQPYHAPPEAERERTRAEQERRIAEREEYDRERSQHIDLTGGRRFIDDEMFRPEMGDRHTWSASRERGREDDRQRQAELARPPPSTALRPVDDRDTRAGPVPAPVSLPREDRDRDVDRERRTEEYAAPREHRERRRSVGNPPPQDALPSVADMLGADEPVAMAPIESAAPPRREGTDMVVDEEEGP